MGNDQKVTFSYVVSTFLAVLMTWLIHEFSHWVTGELLGYESIMRLNSVSTPREVIPTKSHAMLISAAGPLITFLQALGVFFLLNGNWKKLLYPLLFTPFYMRFLAGIMNAIKPNDEGRIGVDLGIGLYTISILISTILFFLVYRISRKYTLRWKFHLGTILLVLLFSSLLILSDMFFRIRLL